MTMSSCQLVRVLLFSTVLIAIPRAGAGVILPTTFDFFTCASSSPNQCADSQGQKAGSFSGAPTAAALNGLQGSVLFSTSPVGSFVAAASGVNILTDIDMVIDGTIDGSGTIPAGTAIPLAYDFSLQLGDESATVSLNSWSLAYQIDRDSLAYGSPAMDTGFSNIGGSLSGSSALVSGSVGSANPWNELSRSLIPSSAMPQCGGQCPVELDVELRVSWSFATSPECGAGVCDESAMLDMQGRFAFNSTSTATPEPGSSALFGGSGLLLLCLYARPRKILPAPASKPAR
jgi:hypothetical protein